MAVKKRPLETSSRVICFEDDLALMSEEMRKNILEERVNCFVHGTGKEINKVYGAEPKI